MPDTLPPSRRTALRLLAGAPLIPGTWVSPPCAPPRPAPPPGRR